jgi:hypothetical protein
MALEFIFRDPAETNWDSLQQGDILIRNEELQNVLVEAHQYYASATDYKYFMVLTQSCDLVRRHDSAKPKSPYITLAAVRPLKTLILRAIDKYDLKLGTTIKICDKKHEGRLITLLERLLHNTEPSYFFLKARSHQSITEDLCVFLALSVALRVSHYEACVRAKIAQLDDVFQAKVGWLTGDLYSRVGTPDLEEKEDDPERLKAEFYEEVLRSQTAWLSATQVQEFKRRLKTWRREHPGEQGDLGELISQIPDDITLLAQRAAQQLAQRRLLAAEPDAESRAAQLLANDKVLKRIIRGD